jgi:hypothetical protein
VRTSLPRRAPGRATGPCHARGFIPAFADRLSSGAAFPVGPSSPSLPAGSFPTLPVEFPRPLPAGLNWRYDRDAVDVGALRKPRGRSKKSAPKIPLNAP